MKNTTSAANTSPPSLPPVAINTGSIEVASGRPPKAANGYEHDVEMTCH